MQISLASKLGQTPRQSPAITRFQPDRSRAHQIYRWYMESRSAFARIRQTWPKWYRAYAGNALDEYDAAKLKAERRVDAQFSYITKTVNAVIGVDMGDRKEVRFQGVTTELLSKSLAEWNTNLVRYCFEKCDGHRKDSGVLLDQLVVGYGWGGVIVNNLEYPFTVDTVHVDPWEMWPDPNAKDDGLKDARYVIREWPMDIELAKVRWPKVPWDTYAYPDTDLVTSPFPRPVSADGYDDKESSDMNVASSFEKEGCVKVLECQYAVYEKYAVYTDPTSGLTNVVKAKVFNDMLRQREAANNSAGVPEQEPLSGVFFERKRIRQAWMILGYSDNMRLLDDQELPVDEFTYKCATGLPDKNPQTGRTTRFGLVKLGYDPQLWAGRSLSLILEILGRIAKGGVYLEDGAVENAEEFETEYAKPGAVITIKDFSKVHDRGVQNFPSALEQLRQMGTSAVNECMGVSSYTEGTATAERSEKLINNLQQHNVATLNPVLDQMAMYRMSTGILMAKVILATYTAESINRILGNPEVEGLTVQTDPATQEKMPVTDPQTGMPVTAGSLMLNQRLSDFQIQVDTGAASPTSRQAFLRVMTDTDLIGTIAQYAPDVLPKVLPLIFKYSDMPVETVAQIEATLNENLKQPDVNGELEKIMAMPPEAMQQIADALNQQLAAQQPQDEGSGDQGQQTQ